MNSNLPIALLAVSLSVLSFVATSAESTKDLDPIDREYLLGHYTKYEHMIPMRDGVKLHTSVYQPKDISKPYPLLLKRTPYGSRPYGVNNFPNPSGPMRSYGREGYIFVYQDVRGRNGSEGTFVHMRPSTGSDNTSTVIDESTDAFDTIDWLVKNIPNNNGKVGMLGISYPGFYTAAGMINGHPALKAASPQAPISDWFIGDDFHHNGAFYLAHAFRFLSGFGQTLEEPTRMSPRPFDYKTPDGYEFYLNIGPISNIDKKYFKGKIQFWEEMMSHGTYDEFWQARNLLPNLNKVNAAVMTVGGWFDAEDLYGPLKIYESVERNNPNASNTLVMGPWAHGGWSQGTGDHLGHIQFRSKTSEYYRTHIEGPFLRHWLKDGPDPELPEAYVFETGTHQWRQYDTWPPRQAQDRALFFHPNGKLSFQVPTQVESFSEYESDPNKPVPFIPNIAIGMTREHMLDDQRFASTRTDVLVFQTDVLTEDITLAGPITPNLFVSTTGTDSDWVVKLIDVYSGDYPDPTPNPKGVHMGGYQQLVRGEAMRGKFRNSFTQPEPFVPGEVSKVKYIMPDAYHTFRKGHRIMAHIQSSWFPLIDRNPQRFINIYQANESDFQKATQRLFHQRKNPSHLKLRVLDR